MNLRRGAIDKELNDHMRKTVLAFGIFTSIYSAIPQLPMTALVQLEIPAYAKWGKLAVKETQAKYPKAEILDYLHEGNEVNGDLTIEKFKLWLKEGDHEFGVFIRIEYFTETNKVKAIKFRETNQ